MSSLSPRLARTIEAYCAEMDPGGMAHLATVVQRGSAAWFPDEFRAAIFSGELTPRLWEKLTNVSVDDDEVLEEYLRDVWSAVAPGTPFPISSGTGPSA